MAQLLVFGLGYIGRAVAAAAAAAGMEVAGTTRRVQETPPVGVRILDPAGALGAVARASHLLLTAPPNEKGDPLLALEGAQAAIAASSLEWIGYVSSTGVYGDRQGGWVDEATEPAPASERARRRLAAEAAWSAFASHRAVDLFRLSGIYGPARSMLDDIRAGRARRVVKPGHTFGRIHRDDVARAVCAAMAQPRRPGRRVLNLTDDEPAESAAVAAEAARLLGAPVPPAVPFAEAYATMSPMARSFWAESRKVSSRATKHALRIEWLYPTYRDGLRAILAEERGEHPA